MIFSPLPGNRGLFLARISRFSLRSHSRSSLRLSLLFSLLVGTDAAAQSGQQKPVFQSWPPRPVLARTAAPEGVTQTFPASIQAKTNAAGQWKLRFSLNPSDLPRPQFGGRAEIDPAPDFDRVFLAGSFNGWDQQAQPLQQLKNGIWTTQISLADGKHLYKFVIDGEDWISDPRNDQIENDGHGGSNSVLRLGRRANLRTSQAAVGDSAIEVGALTHIQNDPYYLQTVGDQLLIRFQCLAHDVERVELKMRGRASVPMKHVRRDEVHDLFEVQVAAPSQKTPYAFLLHDGALSGRAPQIYSSNPGTMTGLKTPQWAKDAIWYQIMPDRFRNGDAANNPEFVRPWTSDWYASSDFEGRDGQTFWQWYVYQRLYGGDLRGLQQKLGYLKDLGVNALYLNPIFESPSHHKYNATDFRHVDSHLGVRSGQGVRGGKNGKGGQGVRNGKNGQGGQPTGEDLLRPSTWQWSDSDKVFLDFLRTAKSMGFKVILDGVFNHVGVAHPAFQDVMKNGPSSPYADWFDITSWEPFEYQGWAGFGELPVFKKSADGFASDAVKQHIFDVTRRWMDPNGDGDPSDGIDGWRLDVPNEVPMPFWVEWRELVKSINPDAYISGEIWQRAEQWLDGRHFDAVMNYPFAEAAVAWIGHQRDKISASEIDRRLAELRLAYPAEATYALMNLLDSHDTDRLVSMMLNPDRAYDQENREQDPGSRYNNAKPGEFEYRKARLAALLQMTYVGAPMIYYGDEVGMWGPDDPSNRKPMLWQDLMPYAQPEQNFVMTDQLEFYRQAIQLRREHSALRTGSFRTLLTDDDADLWVFERANATEIVRVALNASLVSIEFDLADLSKWADPIDPSEDSGPNDAEPWQQIWGEGNRVGALDGAVWVKKLR
jgi:cyclomaltodextrinase / maltogenic alpha-amylase / neopullulanase